MSIRAFGQYSWPTYWTWPQHINTIPVHSLNKKTTSSCVLTDCCLCCSSYICPSNLPSRLIIDPNSAKSLLESTVIAQRMSGCRVLKLARQSRIVTSWNTRWWLSNLTLCAAATTVACTDSFRCWMNVWCHQRIPLAIKEAMHLPVFAWLFPCFAWVSRLNTAKI